MSSEHSSVISYLTPGDYNLLKIYRKTDNGFYLTDIENKEVLLPNAYIEENHKIGDLVEVFIYYDSEDRLVATTLNPKVTLNEFALLVVKHIDKNGAFMDWGLPKDLLVPYSEQPHNFKVGEIHVIFLYQDERTKRLTGSGLPDKFLNNENASYKPGDPVSLIIYDTTDLGYKVIVDNKYTGLLFKNEVFRPLKSGDIEQGYIKKVREDNKIDVSLNKFGYRNIPTQSEKIIEILKKNNGFLPLTDHSTPDQIVETLGMSKKTFKKAVGDLYKKRVIKISNEGLELL